ncbi:MAG: hypothetical protein Q9228_006286 [Teloschistes exilis]
MENQEDRFETFRTWFLDNGGVFGKDVDLQYEPARGLHLCTSSDSALQSNDCIVSCPRSLTLSSINAVEGNDAFVNRFDNGAIPSLILFRFYLVEQYQLGRLSFWWPYINILPNPLTEHPFETPLYYDDEDMRWIRGYGFSLFKNHFDHCNLALGPLAVARIRPSEHDGSRDSTTGVGWVRLIHNAYSNADNSAPTHVFSPRFLELCSMAFSNAREHDDGYSSSNTELFASSMTRNKLHTACAIAMILQKQYLDILAKNVDLPAWPKNARQFYAARYRRGQIMILQAVVESVITNLQGLTGLDPDGSRDRRVLRLDHVLKAGPRDFLSDFRALLHVGLGTRNADRIQQRGSVDTVFTLWLCGLRLWTLATADTNHSLSVRAELPTRTAQWVSFVCKTYGQVSEIGRRWATMPASNEGESLVEGCLSMIQVATVKNPQSLYNHPAATSGLLLWCFRVILEESFMCPGLEGQAGEENDEIMLFLEQGA